MNMCVKSDKKFSYRIKTVEQAKSLAFEYLVELQLDKVIEFGLPEIDDRYHIWRVPLKNWLETRLAKL